MRPPLTNCCAHKIVVIPFRGAPQGVLAMLELSKIVTREQLCEQLGISANTLRRWIKERDFPHPLNASGRRPFFDRDDVSVWLQSMEVSNDQ